VRAGLHRARRALAGLFALALLFSATDAAATAWILPKGKLVLGLSGDISFASSEFLPDGEHRDFPLRGRFEAYSLQFSARYGLPYNFELSVQTAIKGVHFQADPVILYAGTPPSTLDGYRSSVFDFSERRVGLADIYIAVGHQHVKSPLRVSSFLELKLPTGYDKPQSTFTNDTPLPQNQTDDVALGDAQLDLTYRVHLGYVLKPTLTIFELAAGYRVRLNGPGHQLLGRFKIGQLITRYVVLLGGVDTALTLFSGDVIGRSFVAKDPSQPADQFSFDNNVEQRLLRLDRTYVTIFGGLIARVGGREWVVRVSRVLWGKNYAELTSVTFGVLVSFG
jgi:hypothetical protein